MSDYDIEEGIDIPMVTRRKSKYPWANMEIGHTFFVPDASKKQTITSSAYRFGKQHGMKFTVREVNEEGVAGIRVWRVEPKNSDGGETEEAGYGQGEEAVE